MNQFRLYIAAMKISNPDLFELTDLAGFFFEGELPYTITTEEVKSKLQKAVSIFKKYEVSKESAAFQRLKNTTKLVEVMEDESPYEKIRLLGIDSDIRDTIRFIQTH